MNSQSSELNHNQGVLYVVATPIGNLDDVSDRMRHTLASVSKIAAEDTRRTRHLLSHIGVNTPCFSLHDHNERQKIDYIVQLIQAGESIALVSDAGTPLISDPGYVLVNALRQLNISVIGIPGPCALVTALSIAGLPTDRFVFEGFLPAKQSNRRSHLQRIAEETATSVFYESSHRIADCLADMQDVLGNERKIVIGRELTKTFETVLQGSAAELIQILEADHNQTKGEFVVMLKGAEKTQEALSGDSIRLAKLLSEHLSGKLAAKITAEMFGEKKNKIYQLLLDSKLENKLE